MEAAGVEIMGSVHTGEGETAWSHFRGLDDEVYEIAQLPDAGLRG